MTIATEPTYSHFHKTAHNTRMSHVLSLIWAKIAFIFLHPLLILYIFKNKLLKNFSTANIIIFGKEKNTKQLFRELLE